ncbi:hypothetical protein ACFVZI_52905, partial [Streptomyces mirabilis]
MSSLIEELHRREAAGLHREIDALTERLAQAEERLARLEITRETVADILGEAGADRVEAGSATAPVKVAEAGPVSVESGPASPIGVLTVPPWRPGLAVVLPPAYQSAERELLSVSWLRLGKDPWSRVGGVALRRR